MTIPQFNNFLRNGSLLSREGRFFQGNESFNTLLKPPFLLVWVPGEERRMLRGRQRMIQVYSCGLLTCKVKNAARKYA